MSLQISGGNCEVLRPRSRMKTTIPYGYNQIGQADFQSTREVNRVGTAQAVAFGQSASGHLNLMSELHGPDRSPELLPILFAPRQAGTIQIVIAFRRRQRSPHLGVAETARNGCITPIPERGRGITPRLLHHKLHQRAGIEINDSHGLIALLRNPIGYRSTRARPRTARSDRPTLG